MALSPIDTCVQKRNHSGRDSPAYAELNGQNGNEIGPGLQESARYNSCMKGGLPPRAGPPKDSSAELGQGARLGGSHRLHGGIERPAASPPQRTWKRGRPATPGGAAPSRFPVGEISAWSTEDACAPCADRPSCAPPRGRDRKSVVSGETAR